MVKWNNKPNFEKQAFDKELLSQFINAENKIKKKGEDFKIKIVKKSQSKKDDDEKRVEKTVEKPVDPAETTKINEATGEWINLENNDNNPVVNKTVNVGSIKLNIPLDKRLQNGKMFNKMSFN